MKCGILMRNPKNNITGTPRPEALPVQTIFDHYAPIMWKGRLKKPASGKIEALLADLNYWFFPWVPLANFRGCPRNHKLTVPRLW